jgi:hypothetical protein
LLRDAYGRERGIGGFEVVDAAAVQMQADGNAVAVDDEVALGSYAATGASRFVAPFLAFT